MLVLETKADLQRLVDEGLPESVTLEYKASPALSKENKQRDELCKDVSAFANSAGGQIVYGVEEKNQKPVKLDAGTDSTQITREWIEQVIQSRVQPRIQGLIITPIPFSKDQAGFVLTIPASTSLGPHQAPDYKYYRRHNFQSVPMADYEVRDILRRASTPEPFVELRFEKGSIGQAAALPNQEESKPVAIYGTIGNRSREPAYYTVITIGIDASLTLLSVGSFEQLGSWTEDDGHTLQFIRAKIGIPESFPIFKEANFPIITKGTLSVAFPFGLAADESLVRVRVQTPGFSSVEDWVIRRNGSQLKLFPPE